MPIDPNLIGNAMANWQRPPVYDPLAQYAKIQALKNGITQQQIQQQTLQEGALGLQEKQKAIADQEAIDAAFTNARTTDAAGNVTYDRNKVLATVPGSHVAALQKTFNDSDEAAAKLSKANTDANEAKQDYLAQQLIAIKDANYAPEALSARLMAAVHNGAMTQAEAAQITQQFQKNPTPDGVQTLIDPILAASPKVQGILTQRATAGKDIAQGKAADVTVQKAKDQPFINSVSAAGSQLQLDSVLAHAKAAGVSQSEIDAAPRLWSQTAIEQYRRSRITPEQGIQADQAAQNEKDAEAARKLAQTNADARLKLEQQNAGLNAKKFALEFGGDAVKGWAKQVADNPDTANQVPPALRTQVMAAHTALTGLPFPKPLTGTAVDQERASRNALDAVAAVKEALADPEIQSRVGPILGRLGSAEQSAGTAIGLSPQAAAKAQQLRTNMRYLVFQEGKALLGGRMPQQLMQQLEESSPNVAMDAGTLNGALAGVTDAAGRNLDQTFKQRYGEQAQRPGSSAKPAGASTVPAAVQSALKNAGPGIHTLSDKSRWMVGADGTITPQ